MSAVSATRLVISAAFWLRIFSPKAMFSVTVMCG